MKKRLFTLLFALVAMVTTANAQIVFNKANFPDFLFRSLLGKKLGIIMYDPDVDDEITEKNIITPEMIVNTTELDFTRVWEMGPDGSYHTYSYQVKNLKGIEFFTELTTLRVHSEYLGLSECDFSSNLKLKELDISYSNLTSLDVSKNTALVDLNCGSNQLTSLDVSKNTALTSLDCSYNQLTALDVSKNTALKWLQCHYNPLTSLDVSGCTALTSLQCHYNQLTSLDVSQNTALKDLDCGSNQLTSLDVSKNTALTGLGCGGNQLTSLDLSKNTALERLYCGGNPLTSLDVSQNTALTELWCGGSPLTSLDVSQNTALTVLHCDYNQLASLDVSKNTALTSLYCYSNQIRGAAMDALVASLPTVTRGYFFVIDTKDENEGNICTKAQVAVAKGKGWTVYDYNSEKMFSYLEYEGSDEAILLDAETFPDDNFRNALSKFFDIPENYEITGDLISVTTKLDISNNKITNTIGIEHLTSLEELWCHCNIIAGEAMAKLIVSLTNLNISEAKGLMLTEETNPRKGALYALDFTVENEQNVCTAEHVAAANAKGWTVYCKTTNGWQEYTGEVPTGIGASLNDNGKMTNDNYYSIDGVKLSGEPTKKGLYIHKGKKVVK